MNTDDSSGKTPKKFPIFALAIILLLLLAGLFYLEEDFKGKSAWSQFKRTEEAEGEKFALSGFVPPSVPDDQNFALTPLLRPPLDYTHTTNGVKWRDTNAWQHLMDINLGGGGSGQPPELGDPEQGALADLKVAGDYYRNNSHFPKSAAQASDAEVVLTALNKFAPDLQELRDAAATRALSRFPIEYSLEPSSSILLPHLACVKGITSVCELRAVAELETHRTSDAFADLQLAFRLSDSIRDEPILIDHLVRIATLNIAVQGIREGIARHAWSDSQLLEFEQYLVKLNLLAEYEHALRGERALNLSSLDYIRRHGSAGLLGRDENASLPLVNSVNWLPSGWYYQNMRLTAEMYRDYILPAIDASNRVVSPVLSSQMQANLDQLRISPYSLYAKMLISSLAGSATRPARGQTWVDEARVACALERYRLEHHTLPSNLAALTPQLLPTIPNDLFDGQPLRYKPSADGSYILYSIGWNGVDDGGVAGVRPGAKARADLTKGDWIWKIPAK